MQNIPAFSLYSSDALVLFNNPKPSDNEMLCQTLAELVLMQAIKLSRRKVVRDPRDRTTTEVMFMQRGKNFDSFRGRPVHNLFLDQLKEENLVSIYRAGRIIKANFCKAPGSLYKKFVESDLEMREILDASTEGGFSLKKSNGKLYTQKVRKYLRDANRKLPKLLEKRSPEALSILSNLGPLVLNLSRVPFATLAEFSRLLTKFDNVDEFLAAHPQRLPIFDWYCIAHLPDVDAGKYLATLLKNFARVTSPKRRATGGNGVFLEVYPTYGYIGD